MKWQAQCLDCGRRIQHSRRKEVIAVEAKAHKKLTGHTLAVFAQVDGRVKLKRHPTLVAVGELI